MTHNMDDKRRSKRSKLSEVEEFWDCSVCTYRNSPEAFKCDVCDVRKGTSTRKPRLNPQLVAQQVAQQYTPPVKKDKPSHGYVIAPKKDKHKDKDGESKEDSSSPSPTPATTKRMSRPARLRNIDRSSGTSMDVTVGDVTVTITDYKLKKEQHYTSSPASFQVDSQNNNPTSNSDDIESGTFVEHHVDNSGIQPSQINGHTDMDIAS